MTAAKSRGTDSWLSWKKRVQESQPNVSKALRGSCTLRMEWAEVHYSPNNSQHPSLGLVYTIQGVLASTQFQRAPSKIREFRLLPCELTAPEGLSHFYCVCDNSTLSAHSPKMKQRRTFKNMNFRDNSGGVCVCVCGVIPSGLFRPVNKTPYSAFQAPPDISGRHQVILLRGQKAFWVFDFLLP